MPFGSFVFLSFAMSFRRATSTVVATFENHAFPTMMRRKFNGAGGISETNLTTHEVVGPNVHPVRSRIASMAAFPSWISPA